MTTTIPTELPRLLPGRSAYVWWRRGRLYSVAFFAFFLVAAFISSLLPEPLREIATVGLVLSAIACLALYWWSNLSGYEAVHREQPAGYTTLDYWQYGFYGRPRRRLGRLDPKTGAVVRRPSEEG